MTTLITYDLNKSGQNYQALEKAITTNFKSNIKIATTTFIVISEHSTVDIAKFLRGYIDNNDELFVTRISNSCWYGMSKISDWLKRNLNS